MANIPAHWHKVAKQVHSILLDYPHSIAIFREKAREIVQKYNRYLVAFEMALKTIPRDPIRGSEYYREPATKREELSEQYTALAVLHDSVLREKSQSSVIILTDKSWSCLTIQKSILGNKTDYDEKFYQDALEAVKADLASTQIKEARQPTTASGGKSGENMQPTSETTKGKAETIREQVFIVYSHKDKGWLEDLQTHLKPYMRNRTLTAWSDENISPGAEWFEEIKRALASTKVAVLLVTKDFLASEFIHERELTPLLKEAEKGNVCIIWIPVRACAYNETPLKNYQAAIGPDKPLANMKKADRDKAWVTICEKIKKAGSR